MLYSSSVLTESVLLKELSEEQTADLSSQPFGGITALYARKVHVPVYRVLVG
jgi:hypothetical protein